MSDFFGFQRETFLSEQRLAFRVRQPMGVMLLTGITDGGPYLPFEPPINLGRLYTRHMPGIIEMERAERRNRRRSDA